MIFRRTLTAAVVATALVATAGSAPAQEGRLSLAERVARLEQQAQQSQQAPAPGANIELLNRIQDLQAEVQALRNLVEQQRFELDELKQRQADQYSDLYERIQRRHGEGGETPDAGTAPPMRIPPVPAPPTDPNQLQVEMAAPVDPYTGEPLEAAPSTATPPLASGPAAPAGDPAADYQAAFDALKQGRYDESSRLFGQFLRNYPDHDLSDNAQYWLGESYYVIQNYETALQTFRAMKERYPDGDKAADAELKIGYCLYELGQYDAARQALQAVLDRYPGSTVARLAESRLRALALEYP